MLLSENQQLRKIAFYVRGIAEHYLYPSNHYRASLSKKLALLSQYDHERIYRRVNYYNKLNEAFPVPDSALPLSQVPHHKTTYLFDFRRIMRYFPPHVRTTSRFGDVTDVTDFPRFVKTRPLQKPHDNSILLRLNSIRHFRPITDTTPFHQKKNSLVWRGKVKRDHRRDFFRKHFGNTLCNLGMTNKLDDKEMNSWKKPFLSIKEQLQHKFILSIEGNDVATNLKWIAQSNSLCFMTQPKYESWFMEGTLKPGKHYVQLRDDYSDLTQKIEYYLTHTHEAEEIINNFKRFYIEFTDPKKEHLIGLLVAQKYLSLSGQLTE